METAAQLRALQQLGISVGQGYLLGRPDAQPASQPRDLTDLALDQQQGQSVAPLSSDDGQDLPHLPELVVDQPSPRPIPLQLTAMPASPA